MRGVELTWAGGEYEFLLTVDLLRALQDKCDAGPEFILQRLSSKRWFVDDVIQPIRLGLEGGGLSKDEARKLVKNHVEDLPLTFSVMTARAVLMAALYGNGDDLPGEAPAGEGSQSETLSRAENGASPASTNGVASSTGTSGE